MRTIKIGDAIRDTRSGQVAIVLEMTTDKTGYVPSFLVAYNQDEKPKYRDDPWVSAETATIPDMAICYRYVRSFSIEELLTYPNRHVRELGQKLYQKQHSSWWTKLWRRVK